MKCFYCKGEIHRDSVLGVCDKCGESVWGKKMFNAIKKRMEEAEETGDIS
jgi:uncharacterized protein with PIN domain